MRLVPIKLGHDIGVDDTLHIAKDMALTLLAMLCPAKNG